jgi:predicted RND superfamily exporter protein
MSDYFETMRGLFDEVGCGPLDKIDLLKKLHTTFMNLSLEESDAASLAIHAKVVAAMNEMEKLIKHQMEIGVSEVDAAKNLSFSNGQIVLNDRGKKLKTIKKARDILERDAKKLLQAISDEL